MLLKFVPKRYEDFLITVYPIETQKDLPSSRGKAHSKTQTDPDRHHALNIANCTSAAIWMMNNKDPFSSYLFNCCMRWKLA
jgi:hypothetical protein